MYRSSTRRRTEPESDVAEIEPRRKDALELEQPRLELEPASETAEAVRRDDDGAVDGSGWLTQLAAWISHMLDKYVVDGFVNLLAHLAGAASYTLRRLQTGLVQNYALMIVFGVFALLTLYLIGAVNLP